MENSHLSDTSKLATEFIAKGDVTGWFEELYQTAAGDPTIIPWAGQKPNPHFISWLVEHPIFGNGKRGLVIGCGLGDDAEELAGLGFNVTAFDISPTAIDWAKRRFTETKVDYLIADLFDLPKEWLGAFDFIFECYTIQALPRSVRTEVITKVASLLAPKGSMLIICRGWFDGQKEDNLPWALTKEELQHFETLGLTEISFEEFWDHEDPERKRFRILYENK